MHLAEFRAVGRALARAGLISGASGNLSIRIKDRLIITRHDSRLSSLMAADLVETGIDRNDSNTPLASSELAVHRAIYRETGVRAIVHAHPACAVTLSRLGREIVARNKVMVLGTSNEIVPGALAGEIAHSLKNCSLVMVRGHGSFAAGKTLEEACSLTLEFEDRCRLLCGSRALSHRKVEE